MIILKLVLNNKIKKTIWKNGYLDFEILNSLIEKFFPELYEINFEIFYDNYQKISNSVDIEIIINKLIKDKSKKVIFPIFIKETENISKGMSITKSFSYSKYENKNFKILSNKNILKNLLDDSYFDNNNFKDEKYKNFIHKNIKCNLCFKNNIREIRYKCLTCNNYNLCENCDKLNKHKHDFIRIIENKRNYNFKIFEKIKNNKSNNIYNLKSLKKENNKSIIKKKLDLELDLKENYKLKIKNKENKNILNKLDFKEKIHDDNFYKKINNRMIKKSNFFKK